uniref:Uncharacterized protein n=1 Tax=Cacopsylla melanoneura TaxID=428564 RepID=A0A8D8WUN0_9HEMI
MGQLKRKMERKEKRIDYQQSKRLKLCRLGLEQSKLELGSCKRKHRKQRICRRMDRSRREQLGHRLGLGQRRNQIHRKHHRRKQPCRRSLRRSKILRSRRICME